jgi:hypothetical protein
MQALIQGFKGEGVNELGEIGIFESLMDSKSIFLTPNLDKPEPNRKNA